MSRIVDLKSQVTDFSGLGYANICTYISARTYEAASRSIIELSRDTDIPWTSSEIDLRAGFVGYDRSLRRLTNKESAETVCLGWRPGLIDSAIKSIVKLSKMSNCLSGDPFKVAVDTELPCLGISFRNTRDVNADFEDGVWGVIESEAFSTDVLSAINADYRKWLENNDNYPQECRPVTISGDSGSVMLQICQPTGSGVLIDGSRIPPDKLGHQLSDHNTDDDLQTLGHVVGLCFVLKHCRQAIVARRNIE